MQLVAGLQLSEDALKQSVAALSSRYLLSWVPCPGIWYSSPRHTAGEQKYEDTKTGAEEKLARAGETLAGRQRAGAREVTRLRAQLRKVGMQVLSLEEQIDQKVTRRIMLTT